MKSVAFTEHQFTFGEVIEATGVESHWLRTFLQRDKDSRLGSKHRTGRLLFSLKDISAVSLLHSLNARMRIAPAAAWEILDAANSILAKGEEKEAGRIDIRIGFNTGGQVLVWTRRPDGGIQTWNDRANQDRLAASKANRDVHIVVPMAAIFSKTVKALEIADRWPEDAA